MHRRLAILVLLAATAAHAQLTTTVKSIRLEHATAAELAASTLEFGHVVVNEGNLADVRVFDGVTPGGVRVGSDWWTNNMLSAWGGLSRVDVEALVALSIGNFREKDAAALSAVAAVSDRVDTVEAWGDHAEAGYLPASATNALAVGGLSTTGTVSASSFAAAAGATNLFIRPDGGTNAIYFDAASNMVIAVDGSPAITISPAGDVGVGNTPSSSFSLRTDANFYAGGAVRAGSGLASLNGKIYVNNLLNSYIELAGTNLLFTATNGVTGRIQMIYE